MDALMIGFLAELAADLTSRLIQAVGAALRPKEKQEALKRCMRVAVATLVSRAATDLPADRQQHLEGLLTRFFGLDETLAELRKLLAGDLLDPDAMMNLFLRAGYDAETLPGLDLRAGLRFFEMAFVEEAVHEPALQADVQAGNALNQTRLLREMLALQREAAPRAVDLADARKRYCQLLTDRFRFLQLQGLGFTDRLLPRIELLELYVDLRARPEAPPHEAGERMARLSAKAPPLEAVEAAAAGAGGEPVPLSALVDRHAGLVILGDPGAGKTTFLKRHTLDLATNPTGPLPVLVPVSGYAVELAKADCSFQDYAACYLETLANKAFPVRALLDDALRQGKAVVMVDGLDEVRDSSLRLQVVRNILDFFYVYRPAGNRFLVTSRIVGYRAVRLVAQGLGECTLLEFSDAEIAAFVDKWTLAIERQAGGADAATRAQEEGTSLLAAIERNDGVRRLAANPLLLTILALVKREGAVLPDRRAELYQRYVHTLVQLWNRLRGLGRSLTPDLDTTKTLKLLAPLALYMHEESPGVGLVRFADLREFLKDEYKAQHHPNPDEAAQQLISDMREHAGILMERGPDQYGFLHLTLQEYLAAVGIARKGQLGVEGVIDYLSARAGDPAWREVCLLTVGYVGLVESREEAADAVVRGLLAQGGDRAAACATIAGEAVADVGPGVSIAVRGETVARLVQVISDAGNTETRARATAADALCRLGDPRFRADGPHLPDDDLCGFLPVHAGPFLMGTPPEAVENLLERFSGDRSWYECETPRRRIEVPEFYIGRFPVTNAQYQAFALAGGYANPEHWAVARGAGRWEQGRIEVRTWGGEGSAEEWVSRPKTYGEEFDLPNHPVVGVSWYEALAYCDWLDRQLREGPDSPVKQLLLDNRYRVSLPSETQWEKAARGTADAREFPWGDEPDANRASFAESSIGASSAVGCFPAGVSPCGCLDLAGNVWEWCRTRWQESYKSYRDDNALDGGGPRVVRGGSFAHYAGLVRCAARFGSSPHFRDGARGFRVVLSPF